MAVTTRLTWNEEQSLRRLLGNASLSLLYKSSVHGYDAVDLVEKCSHQGPTVTVIHLAKHVFGIFTLMPFPNLHSEQSTASFCFSFLKENEISTLFLSLVLKIDKSNICFSCNHGTICIALENRCITVPSGVLQKLGCDFRHLESYYECEIFRVDGIKNTSDFIMKIATVTQRRKKLLADLRSYRPRAHLDLEVRILLLGPVGSGKSSFFNSVKSIFRGHLTRQAMVGSDSSSITERYRIYSVKDGKSLPFLLCDSMGLDDREEAGLNVCDVPYILKGYVPDKYWFNLGEKTLAEDPPRVTTPSLKDRIHCVAYVLDINSVNSLSRRMTEKLREIHKEVLNCGIAHVALLTKVSNYDEVLGNSLLNMTKHMTSQSQVINVHRMLGIPISSILMVDNYGSERELNPLKDVVILSALRQMLRAADDFLEDLPPQKAATG